jgi:prefoldin subunit 5
MEVYDRVIKIVAPKRAKLQEAEQELARQMKRLSEKHSQLQQVNKFCVIHFEQISKHIVVLGFFLDL